MEPLPRPGPVVAWRDRVRGSVRGWMVWFGTGRLVAASVSVLLVAAGGVWLARNPAPPTEASLPVATSNPSNPSSPEIAAPRDSAAAASAGEPSPDAPDSAPGDATATTTTAPPILVHVAGAVVEPGVYRLDGDARIQSALAAAGGPLVDADWNALNLAAPLADGMRIYVPLVGEDTSQPLVSGGVAPIDGGTSTEPAAPVGPIDINRATASELDALPGIGPATAAAIVEDRERNGPFASPDDLDRVSGIGPVTVESLRDLVVT